jgi:phosphatidylinositol alpha-mannosyltransferase
VIIDLLRNADKRNDLARHGKAHAQLFDWSVVAEQIYSVYEMSMVGGAKVRVTQDSRSWNRFLSKEEKP